MKQNPNENKMNQNVNTPNNVFSRTRQQQQANDEFRKKEAKRKKVLKETAIRLFSTKDGQKVLGHLFCIRNTILSTGYLKAEPNIAIFEKGINYMYLEIKSLLDIDTVFKAEKEAERLLNQFKEQDDEDS